ncbi:MAG: DinB family protein [Candidatus Sulfotelmatobacter sp.]
MGTATEPMLAEFREEAATTRRVLERVPAQKLAWKPHPKSMTLGQLAWHIAKVPGDLARITQPDSFDVTQGSFVPPQPESLDEIFAAFQGSVHTAETYLQEMTDEKARANWRLMRQERELMSLPRIVFLRSVMLNHWYHHRGQLSVYLRLLDIPLPVIYGPSADESPFG